MSNLPGANTLVMGDTGTGKTYSIRTLIDAGITPFIIFTEQGMETLGDLDENSYHWKYIPPRTSNWTDMAEMATKVSQFGFDALTKMVDPHKRDFIGMIDVMNQCNNFIDQHGKEFGDCATWGTDRCLVIDGLSALNDMAMQLVVGGKLTRGMQDWMVAQNLLKQLIGKLTSDLNCWFVLIAHLSREKNEITGGTEVMVNTLGKALAPEIPKFFSDVVQARREGTTFTWSTDSHSVATKIRNLPISNKLEPSFVPLVNKWKERGGIITPTISTNLKEGVNS